MKRFSVNYASRIPVYKQLVDHYESLVKSGAYKEGQALPSMNELAMNLDISKETVKKAYSILRDKGYVEAKQGKGFYVASQDKERKLTVLVLFDKLSQYKQVLFDSFTERMGNEAEITIRLHNQSVDLLEYYINENLDNYDYYVITPHFPLDSKTQKRALKLLGKIPNRKLILVDRYLESLPGNFGAVYQDFEHDIYEGLTYGLDKLKTYSKLNVITLPSSMYGTYIQKSVAAFCKEHDIPAEFHSAVTPEIIRKNEVYLILNSQLNSELIELVRRARELNFEIGSEIGIISYNESPTNEIILNGLTTVSTDFQQMGYLTAKMIHDRAMAKIKCDFHMIRRKTF